MQTHVLCFIFYSFAYRKMFVAESNRLLADILAVLIEYYTASVAGPFNAKCTYARLLNRSTVGR